VLGRHRGTAVLRCNRCLLGKSPERPKQTAFQKRAFRCRRLLCREIQRLGRFTLMASGTRSVVVMSPDQYYSTPPCRAAMYLGRGTIPKGGRIPRVILGMCSANPSTITAYQCRGGLWSHQVREPRRKIRNPGTPRASCILIISHGKLYCE